MIKLLLVSPQTEGSKGGIAVWTDAFLAECQKHGISCDLLNIATVGVRAERGTAKRNFADEFVRTRSIFRRLGAMLQDKAYEVAHVNTSCGAFGVIRDCLTVAGIKKKQPTCRVLVHFHCDIEMQCRSPLGRFFLKRMVKKADGLLVLNERNRHYLRERFGATAEVLPNFIDAASVSKDERITATALTRVVFVGYVRPEKGIRELYALAREHTDVDFRLVGEVHDEVRGWEKPENVTLCGKRERASVLCELDAADAFVFLSHGEGFSMALVEAMARGLPCIATDVGAGREMLADAGGVIVAPHDVGAASAALESIKDPALRAQMSARNVEKVRSFYTAEAVIGRLARLYNEK